MLLHLLAFGFFATGELEPGTGTINVPAEAVVAASRAVGGNSSASELPINAFAWPRIFDPSDHAPYAFDWSGLLEEDETIATIDEITMFAVGSLLGVTIDTTVGHIPTIDAEKKQIGLWFFVDPTYWTNPAFTGAGTQVGVAFRITTTADPARRYERTAVLTVRQQ